ncbi:MAG: TonB-dependent receptor [Cyclobacteriaceae bacterium]|nr:TonB-dependent receptor [Cyclobacteriaceae bacterium]
MYEDFYYESDNRYDFKDEAGLQWGNLTSAFRWNHVFNKKLFSNATLTYSNYLFTIFSENYKKTSGNVYEENIYQRGYQSSIKDIAARADFEYFPDSKQDIRFGASAIGHVFRPGVVAFKSNVEVDTTYGTSKIYANELDAYIEDDIKITKALKANIGLHGSAFFLHDTSYYSLQPRVAARYMLDNKSSVKASFSRMTQYIHLLTNSSLGLPTDLWVPAMKQVTPQSSNQYAVGLARSLGYDFEITLEGFYKTMNNLIEYSEGASFLNTSDEWYEKVEMGKGTSKGIELFIQRKTGIVNGWIGYTLSRVTREFETLNGGKPFPFKYDRTHDVSIVLNAEPREDMDVSAVWVYGTGNAITLPRVKYAIEGPGEYGWYNTVKYYGERNSFRMPAYHRFDISATWHKPRKWGETSWTVGVFNLYNRRNPFYIDLGWDRQGRPKFIQYSFFQLIPSASYSFKF